MNIENAVSILFVFCFFHMNLLIQSSQIKHLFTVVVPYVGFRFSAFYSGSGSSWNLNTVFSMHQSADGDISEMSVVFFYWCWNEFRTLCVFFLCVLTYIHTVTKWSTWYPWNTFNMSLNISSWACTSCLWAVIKILRSQTCGCLCVLVVRGVASCRSPPVSYYCLWCHGLF